MDGYPEIHKHMYIGYKALAEHYKKLAEYHKAKAEQPLCEIEFPKKPDEVKAFTKHITKAHDR